jgi:hypothetical protein
VHTYCFIHTATTNIAVTTAAFAHNCLVLIYTYPKHTLNTVFKVLVCTHTLIYIIYTPYILNHMNLYVLYLFILYTALKAASYFDDSRPIPPTLAFGLGSLGFLAPFAIEDARPMITRVLQAHIKPMGCTLRTRLRGEVYSRYDVAQQFCF